MTVFKVLALRVCNVVLVDLLCSVPLKCSVSEWGIFKHTEELRPVICLWSHTHAHVEDADAGIYFSRTVVVANKASHSSRRLVSVSFLSLSFPSFISLSPLGRSGDE